jgi:2,3-bisphosphoglycerate-dependent phosphoglycerate mutase
MTTSAPPFAVVFIRHGHSEWNLTGRFTGWTDIALTKTGLAEAAQAGRRLASAGYVFDEAHGSVLRRTRQTLDVLLDQAGCAGIPIFETWRLNERHYGALQGMSKEEIFAAWGEARSRRWWRGYHEPPPPLDLDDRRHPRFDPLYAGMDQSLLPSTESLADCQRRTLPYWRDIILPRLAAGRRLLIASHGNTLRGLVMHLDGITPEEMERVEIPSAIPFVYRFAADLRVLGRDWLD